MWLARPQHPTSSREGRSSLSSVGKCSKTTLRKALLLKIEVHPSLGTLVLRPKSAGIALTRKGRDATGGPRYVTGAVLFFGI